MIATLLSKFSDLLKQDEFASVEFIARVTDLYKDDEDIDRVIIRIFDGYEHSRFIVYGISNIVDDIISVNTVYKFKGSAGGEKRRYFVLKGAELVPITIEVESKYFPEKFKRPTNYMYYVYNTSIAKIHGDNLRHFVCKCLGLSCNNIETNEKLYEKFATSPASLRYHDSYLGGFVAHIAGMLMIVDSIEENNCNTLRERIPSNIDWDLLRSLVYLHDVGKPLTYYKDDNSNFKWNENYLENHAIVGSHYVYDVWVRTKLIDLSTMQKLCYGISTHMDTVKNINDNKIPEVKILKAIDMLEASIADLY